MQEKLHYLTDVCKHRDVGSVQFARLTRAQPQLVVRVKLIYEKNNTVCQSHGDGIALLASRESIVKKKGHAIPFAYAQTRLMC